MGHWRVAERAYTKSDSPEGRMGDEVMMSTIVLFDFIKLRMRCCRDFVQGYCGSRTAFLRTVLITGELNVIPSGGLIGLISSLLMCFGDDGSRNVSRRSRPFVDLHHIRRKPMNSSFVELVFN